MQTRQRYFFEFRAGAANSKLAVRKMEQRSDTGNSPAGWLEMMQRSMAVTVALAAEQKATPAVPASKGFEVQQNLLQLLRNRQAAAAATSVALPQGLQQYGSALAHGVDSLAAAAADRSSAFSAARAQPSEKLESGIPQVRLCDDMRAWYGLGRVVPHICVLGADLFLFLSRAVSFTCRTWRTGRTSPI